MLKRGRKRDRDSFRLGSIALFCAWAAPGIAGLEPDGGRAEAPGILESGFLNPPAAAQPRVIWHWVGGNVTDEGVRLDLKWMQAVGIAGVVNVEVSFHGWSAPFDIPQQVPRPVDYLSPEWRKVFQASVRLAAESGLEFVIGSSPGWTNAGGPWVKPRQAMKKLVWSETAVEGGRAFEGRLSRPPATTGLFQNLPAVELGAAPGTSREMPEFYADVAAIAYRAPASEAGPASLDPVVTSSAGPIDAVRLAGGDPARAVALPFGQEQKAWIQFSFALPQRIQAITAIVGPPLFGLNPLFETREIGSLESSDDGRTFHKVADLPRSGAPEQTASFRPRIARIFRVVLDRPEPTAFEKAGLAPPAVAHRITKLVLQTAARINRFEDKAGYSSRQIVPEDYTPAVAPSDVVGRNDIVDLTGRMRPDGSLDWTPPAGRWMVLRLGYSLVGRTNHPAPRTGTGLEVDKLNRVHVKSYLDTYLSEYQKTLGPKWIGRNGLQGLFMDSNEAGAQNWTDDMLVQFKKRRGYDALPWLPVLTGRVVESAESSDRFLWDFRKTLGDLIAESLYGQFAKSLHERGMVFYEEAHEAGRAFVSDGMEAKKWADIPMGAMWAARRPVNPQENYDADLRESAAVAHLYGKTFVAGESFTSAGNPYGFSPENLKPVADRELAMGVNRFVIHTSVHQPDSKVGPGIGLGPYGTWFSRKETWAAQAGPWVSYLARSSFLLQQGRFVADIAYLYGEDTNVTSLFHAKAVPVPEGYGFDFVNSDALLHEFSTTDGMLTTRSGMKYRVLALDESTRRMSLPVLRKIRDLVRTGAVVVGAAPPDSPSLTDDEVEFRALVAELWGGALGERRVGLGKVMAGRTLAEALPVAHLAPDVIFAQPPGTELRFVHRALADGDLYFISSGSARAVAADASFRVTGRAPELWRADTGAIAPLSYSMENGRTIVPLQLDPNDAVFVVFRGPAAALSRVVPEPTAKTLATLEGPWEVSFPPGQGAPDHARFADLQSWTASADPGVKYFSGTATYGKSLQVPPNWLGQGTRVWLDLGTVKNLAEVAVNGRSLGLLWKAPFKIDVTGALKVGENRLDIRVTNLWPNRLIGDKQPAAEKIASAPFNPFNADSPMLPSGLLGPITLFAP